MVVTTCGVCARECVRATKHSVSWYTQKKKKKPRDPNRLSHNPIHDRHGACLAQRSAFVPLRIPLLPRWQKQPPLAQRLAAAAWAAVRHRWGRWKGKATLRQTVDRWVCRFVA